MSRIARWLILALILFVLAGPLAAHAQDDPEALAQALVDSLVAGDYAGATANFDSQMAAALSADQLRQAWETLLAQVGPYQSQVGITSQQGQGTTLVVITLQFEKAAIDVQIGVNAQGKIVGLFLTPHQEQTPPPVWEQPAYADPARFTEQDVTITSGDWSLPGTLTLPHGNGPFPAVVLVHGSGPNDRDESIGANKPFKDLAWGLASRGIAVLHYDKRTFVYGVHSANPPSSLTVKEETIDDALAAVALLKRTEGIDPARIVLIGHSLGGYLAPRIARQSADLAGIIVLAGFSRPFEDLIFEQNKDTLAADGDLSADDQALLDTVQGMVDAIKSLKPGDTLPEPIFGAEAAYWIDLNTYDPRETAQGLSTPMFLLQGERDFQVKMTDFQGWQDALSSRGDVTFKSYPALNHLFIAGEGPGTLAEYDVAGHVQETVVTDIADWILAQH